MINLVDGQVYRWRWADQARHEDGLRPWGSYHCKSRIGVVVNGQLVDTFWGDMTPDRAVSPAHVSLTLLCDVSWPKIPPGKELYYHPSDVVDTRHSNNSGAPIYLRPGATYSAARLTEEIEYRKEKARSEISSAERKIERLILAMQLIEADKLDEVML